MGLEFTPGLVANNIQESLGIIESMASANVFTPMEQYTKESGKTVNNTELVN
jgi:hypothetical protein